MLLLSRWQSTNGALYFAGKRSTFSGQGRLEVAPCLFRYGLIGLCHGSCLSVAGLPPGRVAPGAQCDAVGNAVQPARQGILLADGSRLAASTTNVAWKASSASWWQGNAQTADIPDSRSWRRNSTVKASWLRWPR